MAESPTPTATPMMVVLTDGARWLLRALAVARQTTVDHVLELEIRRAAEALGLRTSRERACRSSVP